MLGCAPVTMSPMAIRMRPEDLHGVNAAFGVRSGPRVSAPMSTTGIAGGGSPFGGFHGDKETFSLGQWGAAFDLVVSKALSERTSIYAGGQGEMYYPLPLPAYGLYGGISQYYPVGDYFVGPALTLRGATDFGIGLVGGPGSVVGAELSCALGYGKDPDLPIALVPFYGHHATFAGGEVTDSQYVGAAFATQIRWKLVYFEISGGFGRVFQPGRQSWNAPIIGFRVGH